MPQNRTFSPGSIRSGIVLPAAASNCSRVGRKGRSARPVGMANDVSRAPRPSKHPARRAGMRAAGRNALSTVPRARWTGTARADTCLVPVIAVRVAVERVAVHVVGREVVEVLVRDPLGVAVEEADGRGL